MSVFFFSILRLHFIFEEGLSNFLFARTCILCHEANFDRAIFSAEALQELFWHIVQRIKNIMVRPLYPHSQLPCNNILLALEYKALLIFHAEFVRKVGIKL